MKLKIIITLVAVLISWHAEAQNYDTNGDYIQTFAGSGEVGYVNGQGQQTKFSNPSQIVADTSSNLYVWDSGNYLIREITPDGTVSTFAGGGIDFEGYGTNVSLSLYSIGAMAMDHSNTIWMVASYGSPYLLNISTNSYVTIQNGGSGLTNLSVQVASASTRQTTYIILGEIKSTVTTQAQACHSHSPEMGQADTWTEMEPCFLSSAIQPLWHVTKLIIFTFGILETIGFAE